MTDYYAVLAVPRNCTDDDVRKAYRKLALKWHPEKNPDNKTEATAQFKKVAEAFEVLTDAKRRAVYDQYGEDGLKRGVPDGQGGFVGGWRFADNADAIFAQFFGTSNPFERMGYGTDPFTEAYMGMGGVRGIQPRKAPPVTEKFTCTLEEIYKGCMKRLKITRQRLNPDGQTTHTDEKMVTIEVKRGWKAGTKVTFENEGDEGPGVIAADVVFVLELKPHSRFTRDGDDLIFTSKVTLSQALSGFTVDVVTLDGTKLQVPINEIVYPGYQKVIKGQGMPVSKSPGQVGNLILRFHIVFPDKLTEEQKNKIKDILNQA